MILKRAFSSEPTNTYTQLNVYNKIDESCVRLSSWHAQVLVLSARHPDAFATVMLLLVSSTHIVYNTVVYLV